MDRYTLSSSFPPQSRVYSALVIFFEGYVVLFVLILAVCILTEYGKFVFAYTFSKLLHLIFGQCTVLHFLTAEQSFCFQKLIDPLIPTDREKIIRFGFILIGI